MSTIEALTLEILEGPDWIRDKDGHECYAYSLGLSFADRSMVTPWQQGIAITDDPTVGSVLACLISDWRTVDDCTGFASWAQDLGLNPDSISDRDMYQQGVRLADDLEDLLGRRLLVALSDDEDATHGDDTHFFAAWARVSS